jgi:cell filamentation protein
MADLYQVIDDPYIYPDTNILRNKLGLLDGATLEAFELEMSLLRAEEPLPDGRLSATHYRRIHRHIFQDVYAWAGRYRTVRTGKGGNWFCYPENIAAEMQRLFGALWRRHFSQGGRHP